MITVLWQVDAVFSLTCDLIDVCLICTFSLGIRSGNPYFLFQSSNRSHLDLIVMYISKHCYFPFICVKCVLHLLLIFFSYIYLLHFLDFFYIAIQFMLHRLQVLSTSCITPFTHCCCWVKSCTWDCWFQAGTLTWCCLNCKAESWTFAIKSDFAFEVA